MSLTCSTTSIAAPPPSSSSSSPAPPPRHRTTPAPLGAPPRPRPRRGTSPSCSGRATAIEGPGASSDPLLPFEYACSDHLEHGVCHPYAAPDGCEPQIAAFLDPGASHSELWDGATYRPRELPEACRGEPTPFVGRPHECATCGQRRPALAGPHEAVITAFTDVVCDGGECSVIDLAATIEVRVPFTPPIVAIGLAID